MKKCKCCWTFSTFEFLGFVVGNGQLSISEAKVQYIKNYVLPSSKSDLRDFLGLVTFYSRFIPDFANHTFVLNAHLHNNCPDMLCYDNDSDFVSSFDYIVSSIANHSALFLPNCVDAWCLYTDASTKGIGSCLCIYRNNHWVPVAFYSHQL